MHFLLDFFFQKVVYPLANQLCDKMGWTLGVQKLLDSHTYVC
jgi:hypothetical protein